MRRTTLARWLVVGALAGFGLLVGAEIASAQAAPTPTPGTTVQNANGAGGASAASGNASGSNGATAVSGPVAAGGPVTASDISGGVTATIVQEGDNKGSVSQSGTARSGDSVAGSQVTGVVSSGSASVTQTNTSEDADARSGDATVSNSAVAIVGPVVTGGGISPGDITGSVTATIVQEGDNSADVSQTALAETGDAVAGGQVAGVVTEAGGSASLEQDNTSEDADADSGDADTTNGIVAIAGPLVSSGGSGGAELPGEPLGGPILPLSGMATLPGGPARPLDITGPIPSASIVQEGDDELTASQDGTSGSGDAVAGGQVAGLVAEEEGNISVVNRQSSEDATADTGDASSANSTGLAFAGPLVVPGLTVSDITGGVQAAIVQEGDNSVDLAQKATSASGDAVAGAQVLGVVASGGSVDLTAANTSEDADARSGDASATNTSSLVFAGPLFSDGDVTITDITGPIGTAGPAVIVQEGDNQASLTQAATASSGDAVAGGQVAGVVGEGGEVSADLTNTSEDDSAETGDADAANDASATLAGPLAVDGAFTVTDITGPIAAAIVQEGDNELALDQTADATSGDAVAGGQVLGVVGGGDADITASNTSEDADATSGDATAVNDSSLALAGPLVATGGVTVSDIGPDIGATIVQEGDNTAEASQSATATTGDAVAAGQVLGAVAEGSVTVDATNSAEDAEAESGDADAASDSSALVAGPVVVGGGLPFVVSDITGPDIGATIVQEGDNDASLDQAATAATGDAVAGAAIFGVVGGGDVSITASNTSEDASAQSGDATALSDSSLALAGPLVATGGVTVSDIGPDIGAFIVQEGDNTNDVSQSASATTGDAVGGGQVFGVVAEAGSVSVDATNTSDGDSARSGDADATADSSAALAGPVFVSGGAPFVVSDITGPVGADIVQEGDNDDTLDQSASAASGDAVAGGQVVGVVGGGDVSITASNTSEDADARSGDAAALSDSSLALAGPLVASGDVTVGVTDITGPVGADIVQEGDNTNAVSQSASATTGDAVGGGQVFGVVAEAGSVSITASNTSEDASADSGDADATADSSAALAGPVFVGGDFTASDITGLVIVADIVQEGDNDNAVDQSASAASGDAVAGGQVFGVVGEGGAVSIDATNSSQDDDADSGDATALADSSLALAGPLDVVGDFTVSDITGLVIVDIVQEGDNDTSLSQSADATSGDAVAGGQVMGVVGAGDADITASNTSEDASADSGDADATADSSAALAGPVDVGGDFTASDITGLVFADIVQEGDNTTSVSQSAGATSGDAVAGGQVVGAVTTAGADVTVDVTNTSEDADADSGDATATNHVSLALAGPLVVDGAFTVSDITGPVRAIIVQEGDNDASADQTLGIDSGDAVAGAQVLGIVAGGTVDVSQQNTSSDDSSDTGDADGTSDLSLLLVGPAAINVTAAELFAIFA